MSINGQGLEGQQQFVYMGNQVSSTFALRPEQSHLIDLAAGNKKNLSCIWHQSYLSLKTSLRLYMSVVPILLHASEMRTLTKQDLALLQSFHIRCQRQIIGIHCYDRVSNVEATRCTG